MSKSKIICFELIISNEKEGVWADTGNNPTLFMNMKGWIKSVLKKTAS